MHIYKLYLNSPTSNPSIAADSPTWYTNTTHSINIANTLLAPFSAIGEKEQACAATLLGAIVRKVEEPHSTWLTKSQVKVAYECPTQLLTIAVWAGIDISDSGFINAKGQNSDISELFRRIVVVFARNVEDIRLCIDTRDAGLAYIQQDLCWLRRAHRNYRIYQKYGILLETRFTGEWYDQGEEMFDVGLVMWGGEEKGEKGKERGWMKRARGWMK
ncbi:hypothetical protein CTheo_1786 [Ceratobasidium theobromae]|uniref:Uncharacterized protein n=1 Tax=Ceratobasidium theobromae TaxID=1582974 RepID=A0A5N5QUB9_9AGAM|nr:hypothetical protein CTheo_1786 [Ceratobasidium theobromae]